MKKTLMAGALLLSTALCSWADIVPTFQGTAPSPDTPGATRYFYTAGLSSGTRLDTSTGPQYFVLYDFFGYVAGSAGSTVPGNFSPTAPTTGPIAFNQGNPGDDPGVPNIVFTYSGPVVFGPVDDPLLGTFFADSIFDLTKSGFYQSQTTKDSPGRPTEDGKLTGNTGPTTLPVGSSVPEPGSLALVGSGLLGASLFARRRRASN